MYTVCIKGYFRCSRFLLQRSWGYLPCLCVCPMINFCNSQVRQYSCSSKICTLVVISHWNQWGIQVKCVYGCSLYLVFNDKYVVLKMKYEIVNHFSCQILCMHVEHLKQVGHQKKVCLTLSVLSHFILLRRMISNTDFSAFFLDYVCIGIHFSVGTYLQ